MDSYKKDMDPRTFLLKIKKLWLPGKKKRPPLDIPIQEDRIVQEAIRGILECILEPEFVEFKKENDFICTTNYGFRPNKSTWNAIEVLKLKGQATTYAIEGDIVGAYNNVNHNKRIQLLSKRIHDKKFIKGIQELLKNGGMEKSITTHSIIGTPQRGIVSPLLFNIYMFEFYKYINTKIIPLYTTNTLKKRNPEYQRIGHQMKKAKELWKISKNPLTIKENRKIFNDLSKERMTFPSYTVNTLPKKRVYARYADDWVLLLTCSLSTAQEIKGFINKFVETGLFMELDSEKTLITKLTNGVQFLDFSIRMNPMETVRGALKTTKRQGKYIRFKRRTI